MVGTCNFGVVPGISYTVIRNSFVGKIFPHLLNNKKKFDARKIFATQSKQSNANKRFTECGKKFIMKILTLNFSSDIFLFMIVAAYTRAIVNSLSTSATHSKASAQP